jgi:hypothetical protein
MILLWKAYRFCQNRLKAIERERNDGRHGPCWRQPTHRPRVQDHCSIAGQHCKMTARSRRGIAEYPAKPCPTFVQEN